MSVRVTNHTAGPLSVPGPLNRVLRPGETRDFPYVLYDEMANDERFITLMNAGSITMENTDAAASFSSLWNGEFPMRMGTYHLWIAGGQLRFKNGMATSAGDGTVVNAGALGAHGFTHALPDGLDPIPGAETLENAFTCLAGVGLLKLVYESAANTVVYANATSIATMPAIGITLFKPAAVTTTVYVATVGEVAGFVGLTPDAPYFASELAAGGITVTPPSTPGNVVQQIGYAVNTTTLMVALQPHTVVS